MNEGNGSSSVRRSVWLSNLLHRHIAPEFAQGRRALIVGVLHGLHCKGYIMGSERGTVVPGHSLAEAKLVDRAILRDLPVRRQGQGVG